MSSRLGDRLKSARRRRFVGREAELDLFGSLLAGKGDRECVLYLHGPGGIGKSTLLGQMAEVAEEAGRSTCLISGESGDPTREAIQAVVAPFSDTERPLLLVLDAYERFGPLEEWLRGDLFPSLPDDTLILIASRNPLSTAWRSDPSWQGLIRARRLQNFSAEESARFLENSKIPEDVQPSLIKFTHGHPLALTLAADLYSVDPESAVRPETAPDLIFSLVSRLMDGMPEGDLRRAVHAAALPRVLTEPLLASLLGKADAADEFEWLRGRSFFEAGAGGLQPHDLARTALIQNLKWRNPDEYRLLHDRARAYYSERLGQAGVEAEWVLFDYIYLHRNNPIVEPFFNWEIANTIRALPVREEQLEEALGLIGQHEGAESAELARRWFECQPGAFVGFHEEGRPGLAGVVAMISLNQASSADIAHDPGTRAADRYLREHAPLRPGEDGVVFRFWMAAETYQAVSPVQSQIFVAIVRRSLAGAAHTFIPAADPEFWSPLFGYAELERLRGADFEVGGRSYAWFGHDWRTMPAFAWFERLGQKELGALGEPVSAPAESSAILGRDAFDEAVRNALKGFATPGALRDNPLLRSQVVLATGAKAPADRESELKAVLVEVSQSLRAHPKTAKAFRALDAAFLRPVGSQEAAAEKLDVSLSSFRRHLAEGVARVCDLLWLRELEMTQK